FIITLPVFGATCGGDNPCSCGDFLNESRTFNGSDNLTDCSGTALIINASDLVLDCNGTTISGNNSGYGINLTNYNNATIKNCIVMNFSMGIRLYNSSNNNLTNNTVNNNIGDGIYLYNSSNNNLINNIANNNSEYGIELHSSSNSNILTFNTIEYNKLGIELHSSSNNTLTNNIANNNSQQGIVLSYSSNNTLTNNTANNNSVGGFHLLYSSNSNLLTFNTIENNEHLGIYLYNSLNNNITNNTVNNNIGDGIYLYNSSNNTLTNNTITNNTDCGIYVVSSSSNNIYNNFFNNTNNFNFTGTIYQNYWNTTKQNGTRIYSTGTQIGGNYWTNPNGTGYSDTCIDANDDNFCDASYNLAAGNIDCLVLTESSAYLNLIPSWNSSYKYTGNKTLSAGETENENTTRNLFINLNQTKTLSFIINNSGTATLMNLSQINSTNLTNGTHTLNFTIISLSNNISSGEIGYLNITIETPENSSYLGNYSGWIYLTSSNGEPYNYLNLTLNITVTNQTLPKLNKTNEVYYFESDNSTELNFSVYFFDNRTIDDLWNSSAEYNLSLVNSTNNSQVLQNINFSVLNGLFSGTINTTNLTEGENYTILGNLNDTANNTANINLTFELLNNLDLNVTSDLNSVVKGYSFDFTANVSKIGDLNAENVTVCLNWSDSNLKNLSALCASIGDINGSISNSTTWQLNGTTKGVYTINLTAFSEDGRFNKTIQQNITVKYGVLDTSLCSALSSKQVNQTFDVSVYVNNTGNWNATNITVKIEVCSTTKSTNCSAVNITNGSSIVCKASGFSCTSTGTKDVDVILSGAINATYSSPTDVGSITITASTTEGSTGGGADPSYAISFLEPDFSSFNILQGGNYDLQVEVKNTGDTKLNELYLTLTGISSNCYSISPSTEEDLSAGSKREFTIRFTIPEDLEAKDYSLALKAKSDEKDKSKLITLTVKKVSIVFINLTDLNITQGGKLTKKFKIKNNGDVTLHNLFPNSSSFNIIPATKINLDKNEEKEYIINISVSETEKFGYKEITVKIISDEKNFTKKFNLTILPGEEEKTKIDETYNNLLAEFENLTKRFADSKNDIENASVVESKIENINQTINQIKTYLGQGNYLEANKLIEGLGTEMQELSDTLPATKTQDMSVYLIIGGVILLTFVGFILFYIF
ncbi:MAG: right-handed parallel beta-helix repeat-containing protein, partial [Candidatus Aenigmarchaeota archaeon]|nr:right-handed parallel beta-helix repeat-containing protein [Candidatus Aenigmarchaeota archaeon]